MTRPAVEPVRNLLILEMEVDESSEEEIQLMEKIKEELRSRGNSLTCFIPAASCKRHVFLFDQERIDPHSTPLLHEVISHNDAEFLKIHRGNEAVKFLSQWCAGTLNKGKYYNDTYNAKVVRGAVDIYKDLMELATSCSSNEEFLAKTKEKEELVKAKIAELRAAAEEKDGVQKIRLIDEANWEKLHLGQIEMARGFSIFKFSRNEDSRGFASMIEKIFITDVNPAVRVLRGAIQSTEANELWSNNASKPNLERMKKRDRALFEDILNFRYRYSCEVANAILDCMNHKVSWSEMPKLIAAKVAKEKHTEIVELSERAREFVAKEAGSVSLAAEAGPPTAVSPVVISAAATGVSSNQSK